MRARRSIRRLMGDRRGATAIEYALILGLIALTMTVALPKITQSLNLTMVTAREGMKGKLCEGDPTQEGTQCR